MKRTCPTCHARKSKYLFVKHRKYCMGGKPVDTMVGGTGKEVDYKKKQKQKGGDKK